MDGKLSFVNFYAVGFILTYLFLQAIKGLLIENNDIDYTIEIICCFAAWTTSAIASIIEGK